MSILRSRYAKRIPGPILKSRYWKLKYQYVAHLHNNLSVKCARETAERKRGSGTGHFNLWRIFLFHSTQYRWIFPLIINWKWSSVSNDFCGRTVPRNRLHKETEVVIRRPLDTLFESWGPNVWQRFLTDSLRSMATSLCWSSLLSRRD